MGLIVAPAAVPLSVAGIPGRISFPGHSLTLIAKATCRLVPAGTAQPVQGEPAPLTGDLPEADGFAQACDYESDFACYKPRADVLLVGSCHPPGGVATDLCAVELAVGAMRKSLVVLGDHHERRLLLWRKVTDPAPFREMPLTYDRGYGGAGFARNPIGTGHGKPQKGELRLPNVQYPPSAAEMQREPAGFGPIHRTWEQRAGLLGTYGRDYVKTRWPWFAADFDWGHFNAAPADQQVEGYLRGDEEIVCRNLHPEHAEYRCRLPGLRLRGFVDAGAEEVADFREVPMNLDTLWVDMASERLVLVWRGVVETRSPDHEEIAHAYFVTEDLAAEPEPLEHHAAGLAACLQVAEDEEAEEEEPDEVEPAVDEAAVAAVQQAEDEAAARLQQQLDKAVESAREVMADAGLDPTWADRLATAEDRSAVIGGLMAELGLEVGAPEDAIAMARANTAKVLDEHGADGAAYLAMFEEPEPPSEPPEPELDRPRVEALAQAGESFADVELSGLDLSGAALAGANLAGVNLAGVVLDDANLSGADLTGANLSGADLQRADFNGATLCGADLSSADCHAATFTGADLSQACCVETDFSEAVLDGARLERANGERAVFFDANLSGAALTDGQFAEADFRQSRLDGADLRAAGLAQAHFDGATGDAVDLTAANIEGLRMDEATSLRDCSFEGCTGSGASLGGAGLNGARLSGARLVRASFTGCDLQGADFARADLSHANLSRSDLTEASLPQANLFRATLERAVLARADFAGSNLYQVEFLDAELAGAEFRGANLAGTKLEDSHPRDAEA